jgi:hypothetical protein
MIIFNFLLFKIDIFWTGVHHALTCLVNMAELEKICGGVQVQHFIPIKDIQVRVLCFGLEGY